MYGDYETLFSYKKPPRHPNRNRSSLSVCVSSPLPFFSWPSLPVSVSFFCSLSYFLRGRTPSPLLSTVRCPSLAHSLLFPTSNTSWQFCDHSSREYWIPNYSWHVPLNYCRAFFFISISSVTTSDTIKHFLSSNFSRTCYFCTNNIFI
jgi:hypothetical protein